MTATLALLAGLAGPAAAVDSVSPPSATASSEPTAPPGAPGPDTTGPRPSASALEPSPAEPPAVPAAPPAPKVPATPGPLPPSSTEPAGVQQPEPDPESPIQAKYAQLGGAAGGLGAALGPANCGLAQGGCSQAFEHGAIVWTPATGAHSVTGIIGTTWAASGFENGQLGYPATDEVCGLRDGGCYQMFQNGAILFSPGTGAAISAGPIRSSWAASGYENGYLGYPTTNTVCGLRDGGCYQMFQGGAIVWSPATGAAISLGAIRTAWAATGFENGYLGYPTTNEVCGLRDGGCYQMFQSGAIVWSPATGAAVSLGAVRGAWAANGYENGHLGYPTANEVCGLPGGGCYQWYQRGIIWWSPSSGAHPVWGGIQSSYSSAGWAWGWLGYPIGREICQGTTCIQKFQTGTISWENGWVGQKRYNECESLNNGRSVYSGYGARTVSFAVAEGYGQSGAWFIRCRSIAGQYVEDWAVRGTVGASGFKPPGIASGPTRNLYSPTGSYSVTEAFGAGNPGTALPYQKLNPNSRWGGNPGTSTYNRYFESTSWTGWDENMWYFLQKAGNDYQQGAVINYNRPPDSPIVQDAGFAIFLHENPVPTAGCIAIAHPYMVDWLQKAAVGDRIIMGVRGALFR
ncbi:L,D-transpeptidase family protein [Arthrobacter sp. 35W]|uniref:L,D-transpeptidase family protein n=1 Tax=Arthrobacter sp. 35W TaxID=1132441 RepID=UPI0012DEDD7C|nr:L,D-transpeptidase family protein [Arthrobacter sp. 35W]